jgi:uncharacterized membrane protein YkvA (DUF1232 family)
MAEPLRPDAVIGPEGRRQPDIRNRLKEAALALPNLVKLLGRLIRDPRVPARSKASAVAALAYIAAPIDLVPDLIPVLGKSDDVFVAIFVLHHLIRTAGEDVVVEHWDGTIDVLDFINNSFDLAIRFVPLPLRVRWTLNRLLGP